MTEHNSCTVEFSGTAIETRSPTTALALAPSLMAVNELIGRISEQAFDTLPVINIKTYFAHSGSFIVDVVQECSATPSVAVASVAAGFAGIGLTLKQLSLLGKWARGKQVTLIEDQPDNPQLKVENALGDTACFDRFTVNIYSNTDTKTLLSRLAQALDIKGVSAINIRAGKDDRDAATVTREDRLFFRQEEGVVLTDNEVEVFLEVLNCSLNGSPKGWRFSDGTEFSADVEDKDFLEAVKNRKITLMGGTSIRAVLRTTQYKGIPIRCVKTVTKVREVLPPEDTTTSA